MYGEQAYTKAIDNFYNQKLKKAMKTQEATAENETVQHFIELDVVLNYYLDEYRDLRKSIQ